MNLTEVLLLVIFVMHLLSVVGVIYQIGKERKPMTQANAAVLVTVHLIFIGLIGWTLAQ